MTKSILYGGTFNPIHNGHLRVLEFLSEHYDRVILMPNFVSPHKTDILADVMSEDRYQMCRRATWRLPKVYVSSYEINEEEPSYTIDTIKYLIYNRNFPHLELAIGTDQYLNFDNWKAAQEILSLVPVNVISRPGYITNYPDNTIKSKFNFMAVDSIKISSTDIRRRILNGESISQLVPTAVETYIKLRFLYKTV